MLEEWGDQHALRVENTYRSLQELYFVPNSSSQRR